MSGGWVGGWIKWKYNQLSPQLGWARAWQKYQFDRSDYPNPKYICSFHGPRTIWQSKRPIQWQKWSLKVRRVNDPSPSIYSITSSSLYYDVAFYQYLTSSASPWSCQTFPPMLLSLCCPGNLGLSIPWEFSYCSTKPAICDRSGNQKQIIAY